MNDLNLFEDIHNTLEIYIWLSYKYEKEFVERELAKVLKDRTCKIIESIVQHKSFNIFSDIRSENSEEYEDENEEDDIKFLKNGDENLDFADISGKDLNEKINSFTDISDDFVYH
jgi:hypothetical protein